ncbi:MAG: tRNA (adenosine(37)-N6)-dimethylallyltransferase MiaA [Deinococcota bacterium]
MTTLPQSDVSKSELVIPVLAGTTASGKSSTALALARTWRKMHPNAIEIISADAMQVYCQMDIGTAKPSGAELAEVAHHLIDVVNPDQPFSVADYVQRAELAITDVLARGNIPLVVGGTGFYIRGLVNGLPTVPAADMQVQQPFWDVFDAQGLDPLLTQLEAVSPEDAARSQRNPRRVIRALEIITRTDKAPKDFPMTVPRFRYALLALLPSIEMLQPRICKRVDAMLSQGLVAEVESLLARYLNQPTALQAIGYKEVVNFLQTEITLDACREDIILGTVQYAKRQRTWFRKAVREYQPGYAIAMEALAEDVVAEVAAWLEPHLNNLHQHLHSLQ